MRERDIEHACVAAAAEQGCRMRKITTPGDRGWPDRELMISGDPMRFVQVEFKSPGQWLTAMQTAKVMWLMENGAEVWIIDSIAEFRTRLTKEMAR